MKLGLAKLNFQVLRRHNGDARRDQRERQRRAGDPGTQQSRHDRERLYADDRGQREQMQEAIYAELTAQPKLVGSIKKAKNLVRFGTVGVLDGPQVIVPQGQGA
jgi:hypothetical protein